MEQKKEDQGARYLYNLILQKQPVLLQQRTDSVSLYKRKKPGFG
jgi:hypothetical protein